MAVEAVLTHPSLSRLKLPPNFGCSPLPKTFVAIAAASSSHYLRGRLALAVRSATFQDQYPSSPSHNPPGGEIQNPSPSEEESYGEVNRIINSRTVRSPVYADDGSVSTATETEYLVEWKDGHPPSWVSSASIAADVVAEYETPGGLPPARPTRPPSPVFYLTNLFTETPIWRMLTVAPRSTLPPGLGRKNAFEYLPLRERTWGGGSEAGAG
ncbi:hypothetical protein HPP92_021844 [Vanilla planifolia]|uniref:Chromo domain-containing protein n=1 Tax=Vanilla planifolia TaxID=51239 RepID=A0A835PUM0_VANPL|nr:hypothetical protein HPP92_021844 [Vanilla planifolia]